MSPESLGAFEKRALGHTLYNCVFCLHPGLKVGKHCLKSKFAMGKSIIASKEALPNVITDFDILANSTKLIY